MSTGLGSSSSGLLIQSQGYSAEHRPHPRVAVVVVTYQTRDLLRGFLQSVRAEKAGLPAPLSVIVVDNASTDGTGQMVRDEFPEIMFLANAENVGPAGAFNRGLEAALPEADLVVLSNSDVTIHEGTLKTMVLFLSQHPEMDGCCGRLYDSDGSPQVTRTRITSLRPSPMDRPHRATFPGTTFSMIRADAFYRVGGFDETYYFYNEDLDWAERARKAGLRFQYLPHASVTHHSGKGRSQNVSRIRRELYRANLYYYRRHYPALAPLAYAVQFLDMSQGIASRRRRLQRTDKSSAPTEPDKAGQLEDRSRLEQEISDLRDAIERMRGERRSPSEPRIPLFTLGRDSQDGWAEADDWDLGRGRQARPTRHAGELPDDRTVAFITCVNDEVQYAQCRRYIEALHIPPGFRVEVHAIRGAKGMASAYNEVMRRSGARYKVYLHQDVFLLHRGLLYDVLRIFADPGVGMIGVVGATQLPANGVWFRNNALHCYGQLLEYRRSGGPKKLLGPLNRRHEALMQFRRVRTPVLPVATIDGLLMITQYDIPWREDLYDGFIYYEGPQCLEFIRRGLAVGVPRQEQDQIWCMHYGPSQGHERDATAHALYNAEFDRVMDLFRAEYGEFLQVPAEALLKKYREAAAVHAVPVPRVPRDEVAVSRE